MPNRLLVIADDLTGSLDTAVQFTRAGVPAMVTTTTDFAEDADTPVLAVDTESRHLPPEEAARRVTEFVEAAVDAGINRFYKKTDSTLRGNVGAELAALLNATGLSELYFVPALPDAGRTTRGGVQYVDGLPLHLSPYGRDVADPVRLESVSAIVASQTGTNVVCVPRGAEIGAILNAARRPVILVFDAETNADVSAIARQLARRGPPPLLAGCAGFASVVPGLFGLKTGQTPSPPLLPPLLIVCGSMNEVSQSQVRHAHELGVHCWDAPAADAAPAVASALRRDGAAVLTTGASLSGAGLMVRRILEEAGVGTLAVFGGDTASAILEALGVHGVRPAREICQGVVVSRVEASGMSLVTKAGGFGPIDVIQRIRGALEREE